MMALTAITAILGMALVVHMGRSLLATADLLAMGREAVASASGGLGTAGHQPAGCAAIGASMWGTCRPPQALPQWAQPALAAGAVGHPDKGLAEDLRRHLATWVITAAADAAWRHVAS